MRPLRTLSFLTAVLLSAGVLVAPEVAVGGTPDAASRSTSTVVTPDTLAPQWTVADRRSNRSDFTGVPVLVTAQAVLSSSGDLYYGDDLTSVNSDAGTDQAAVFGDQLSYISAGAAEQVVIEGFDSLNRQTYTAAATVAALIPGGWLELRWRDADVVVDKVLADDNVVLSRVELGSIHHTDSDDRGHLSSGWQAYSDVAVAFTVQTAESALTIPVRYVFDSDGLDVLAGGDDVLDGLPVSWSVADINQRNVVLSGISNAGLLAREVLPDGTAVTWSPDGLSYPSYLGTAVVWPNGDTFERGNADGTVTDLGSDLRLGAKNTYSTGATVYWSDYRDGLVRSDAAGDDREVLRPTAATLDLQVDALAMSDGTLSWTDDSALADGWGERSGAWRTTLSAAGPGDQQLIDPDVDRTLLAQAGDGTFVLHRGDTPAITRIGADGQSHVVAPALAVPTESVAIQPTESSVLIRDYSDGILVDLTTGESTPTVADTISENWQADVDRTALIDSDRLFAGPTLVTDPRLVDESGLYQLDSPQLIGDVLVWVEKRGWWESRSGPFALHWLDLSDPTGIYGEAPLTDFTEVTISAAGGQGWIALTGKNYDFDPLVQLYQIGVPTPRAVLAGALGPVAVDDGYVAWTQQQSNGARVVAAQLPTPLPVPAVDGMYRAVEPVRIADSALGYTFNGPIAPSGTASLPIASATLVPPTGVSAVLVNVTVSEPTGAGYLTVYPGGDQPAVSSLNFESGSTVANLVTVPIGSDRVVQFANHSEGSVQMAVDLIGYYNGGEPADPGAFVPVQPARAVDSRIGLGIPGSIAGTASATVNLAGVAGVPTSGVSAVVANVTVTEPAAAGDIALYQTGVERPATSSLNFDAGQTIANAVSVPLGTDGGFVITNDSPGAVHVIVDVAGYYLAGTVTARGGYVPIVPTRVMDTRDPDTGGPLEPASSRPAGTYPNPAFPQSGIGQLAVNATVTGPASAGTLSVGTGVIADGTVSPPYWPDLSFAAGQTIPKLVVTVTDDMGGFTVWNNSAGSTDVVLDAVGYFRS